MEAREGKPRTKIHKPGVSRNIAANSNLQETSRNRVFARRDSTPELGAKSFSFRHEKIISSTEVPSYNLWRSRLDRRSSLPNCLAFGQRKNPTASSGSHVPSVFERESKGLRKYSTALGSSINEKQDQITEEEKAENNGAGKNVETKRILVLPKEETWQQIFSRESSAISQGTRSYCDSVSTIRCTSTDVPVAKGSERRQAYYAKHDSIKRWLSEVE